jgi:hypothetical protein
MDLSDKAIPGDMVYPVKRENPVTSITIFQKALLFTFSYATELKPKVPCPVLQRSLSVSPFQRAQLLSLGV